MSAATSGGNGQAPTQAAASASGNGQAPTTAPANNSSASSSGASNGQAPTTNSENSNYTPPSADEYRRMQQELAEARRDAGKYRDESRKLADAQLTAEQKRERDYTDLQTKAFEYEANLQRLNLENAGLKLAPSLGISDPAAALALVQVEHSHEIKYAADGKPENLQDLLKAVVKDHPALGGQPSGQSQRQSAAAQQQASSSGGATNPGRQAGNGGLTIEMIRAMSPRERMARIEEIRAWEKAQQ